MFFVCMRMRSVVMVPSIPSMSRWWSGLVVPYIIACMLSMSDSMNVVLYV